MTEAEIKHLNHDFVLPDPAETAEFYQIALRIKALVLKETSRP